MLTKIGQARKFPICLLLEQPRYVGNRDLEYVRSLKSPLLNDFISKLPKDVINNPSLRITAFRIYVNKGEYPHKHSMCLSNNIFHLDGFKAFMTQEQLYLFDTSLIINNESLNSKHFICNYTDVSPTQYINYDFTNLLSDDEEWYSTYNILSKYFTSRAVIDGTVDTKPNTIYAYSGSDPHRATEAKKSGYKYLVRASINDTYAKEGKWD